MGQYATLNLHWPRAALTFAALLALLGGVAACNRAPERPADAPAAAVAPPASAIPAPAASESAKSGETAKASDQPMKPMTKAEESSSMPMPGQANDHSTVEKDSKK